MSGYFEQQRREREQQRLRYRLSDVETENHRLRRRMDEIENETEFYDDQALWDEIEFLKGEITELHREIQALKEAKQ